MARERRSNQPLEALEQGARYFEEQNRQANALAETLARLSPLQAAQTYQMGLALQASRQLAAANQQLNSAYQQSMRAVYGWATAGLAGTTMGERLLFQQQMLRREISQLFLPAIEKVSQWLDQIIRRFRQLTGEQQENIGRWLLSGVAMLGLLTLMPKIAGWLDTIRKSWMALTAVMAANPFLAAAAGVAVLMAQTQEGRSQLEEIGTQLLGVFEQVASVLGTVLLPILDRLTEFLSSGIGKVIVWGAVFVQAIRMVQAAFAALALTMLGAATILGALIALVALLALAFQKSEQQKAMEAIAQKVRSGALSEEEGNEAARRVAEEKAEQRQQRGKPWYNRPRWLGGETEEEYSQRVEREKDEAIARGRAANREAANRRGDRHQLLLSQTAQEDPRQTIQRIQSAALRVADPVAKNTEQANVLLKMIAEMVQRAVEGALPGNKDNRDRPPKAD